MKRLATLAIYLCANLLHAQAAIAAQWIKATATADGIVYYFEKDTIATAGENKEVWIKLDASKATGANFDSGVELWRLGCKGRTIQRVQYTHYNSDESIAESGGGSLEKNYAPPDTIGEYIHHVVCEPN